MLYSMLSFQEMYPSKSGDCYNLWKTVYSIVHCDKSCPVQSLKPHQVQHETWTFLLEVSGLWFIICEDPLTIPLLGNHLMGWLSLTLPLHLACFESNIPLCRNTVMRKEKKNIEEHIMSEVLRMASKPLEHTWPFHTWRFTSSPRGMFRKVCWPSCTWWSNSFTGKDVQLTRAIAL